MDERQLGDALLRYDAAGRPAGDPRETTQRILRRDRRFVRWLAGLTVVLWLVATSGVCLHAYFLFAFIEPKLEKEIHAAAGNQEDLPQRVHDVFLLVFAIAKESLILGSVTVVSVVIAGILSVLLVFASRRATLRQVNANLMEISEQLRRLNPAS